MSNIFRFTYYRRIQLSFLILILLPLFAVSFISLSTTKNTVMDKIRLTNQSVLDLTAQDIIKTIDDLTYASNFFVQDRNVRNQLRAFTNTERIESFEVYKRQQEIKDFFGIVLAKTLNVDIRMFLVNGKGYIIQSDIVAETMEQTNRNWNTVKTLVDPTTPQQLQWLGNVTSDDGVDQAYYAARVIRDPGDNAFLATLYIGISSKYFDKLFQQAKSGGFALFDANGRTIAGDMAIPYYSANMSGKNLRSETMLPKTGWKLSYETPKLEVTGQISRNFYFSLLFVLPFFILFFIISIILARRLHLPIHRLQTMAKQFGQGNRNIRFQVKGKDEIAVLGQTLNQMLDQINQLIASISEEQEQKRIMELQALFDQIRPHFLINTLNSIKCSLILTQDYVHSEKIDSLMSLLRAYLKINELSTLRDECKLLGHYIDIMKMRSELQIELDIRLSPGLELLQVPKLLLQPLVENAIVHGFVEKVAGARIEVSAEKLDNCVVEVRITDNGMGMSKKAMDELRNHLNTQETDKQASDKRVGLINVLQRLQLAYGSSALMDICINEQGGVTVVLNFRGDTDVQDHAD